MNALEDDDAPAIIERWRAWRESKARGCNVVPIEAWYVEELARAIQGAIAAGLDEADIEFLVNSAMMFIELDEEAAMAAMHDVWLDREAARE